MERDSYTVLTNWVSLIVLAAEFWIDSLRELDFFDTYSKLYESQETKHFSLPLYHLATIVLH